MIDDNEGYLDDEGDDEYEDTSLWERVRENPGPAKLWLLGVGILIALEFGRILGGILSIISAVVFAASGISGFPTWVGSNFESAFAGADLFGLPDAVSTGVGLLMTALAAVLLLYFIATILTVFGLRLRVADRLDRGEATRRSKNRADRIVLTAIFGLLGVVVLATPIGVIVRAEFSAGMNIANQIASLIPTITSPEILSNQGHRTADGGWSGTFLGLSPAIVWALRTTIVFLYAIAVLVWAWKGYNIYREHYREADWTPRDDTIRRFLNNYWGIFGFVMVFCFVVIALWAPAVSPTTAEQNIYEPYQHEIEYFDEDTGEVESVPVGNANLNSRSDGQNTIGPNSYDDFDRYAPLGTTDRGQDMVTHLAFGARTSLIIGLTAIGLAGFIAVFLSLLTAYYKGIVDIATILACDTVISIPALLLVMMLSVIFGQTDHFLAEPLDGGLLLGLIFAFVYWPGLWRSIRGPSLQVAEQEWVDAAKSYGQTPFQTMRKHMAPYIAGYIMIYASLLLGGVIIFTAALTFLGIGINPPTPEWGRLIDSGQPYIPTSSWHVATVPGLAIVFVVTGLNALGDGIRDAIDPEADVGDDAGAAAAGGGG